MHNLTFTKIKIVGFVMLLFSIFTVNAQTTPVAKYGMLKITGGKVSDKDGNPVILRGMSMFWSGYPEGSPFYNATTVEWLKNNMCVNVIRAAMSYDIGDSKYQNNANAEYAKIKIIIDACIANGIYVIVDFHTHSIFQNEAITFYKRVIADYPNTPNLLFEPFNEPINQSWTEIRNYHNAVVKGIRDAGAQNIIICGTRYYSQEVEEAANNPVVGTNIAYTLHYYANSHKGELRDKASRALQKGIALFVTEYGLVNANGNGPVNSAESNAWWSYLEDNTRQISYVNWAVGNKGETSSIFTPGTNAGNLSVDRLTEAGKLVRAQMQSKCNSSTVTGTIALSFTAGKTQFNFKESVTISAATTVSTGGSIAKVEFYDGTKLIGSSTSSPYSIITANLTPGGHDITAKSFGAANSLIATSKLYPISIVGASNISTKGVTDQFESSTQYSEITGALANCSAIQTASAAGVYWFEDKDPLTLFKSQATRPGNGKLRYLISQAAGEYNVVGFGFGEYCAGTSIKKYTLDLSATSNRVLKLTVSAPDTNTVSLDLKFQIKDEAGHVLAFNKTVVPTLGVTPATWYQHEIGFSKNHPATTTTTYDYPALAPGKTYNFEYDFTNAITINNPNAPDFPSDINTTNTPFDYSKVVEVVIIPVNSLDNGPTGLPKAHAPLAFTNQVIYFSGLQLGDHTLGADFCTLPAAPGVSNKVYCENSTDVAALTATTVPGLTEKWYESSVNGTASLIAPIPSKATLGVSTYYVSQATSPTSTCESPRSALNVTFVATSVSHAGSDQSNATGPSINLTGTGSAAGTWSVVAPTGATVTFTPNTPSAAVTANGANKIGTYTFTYSVPGSAPCAAATSSVVVNVTTVTSLNDSQYLSENVEIYPNPATDNLFVNLNKVSGSKSMKLLDMMGRVVFESSNETSVNIDMSNLTKGLYIVQIQSEGGKLSRTIVKQ